MMSSPGCGPMSARVEPSPAPRAGRRGGSRRRPESRRPAGGHAGALRPPVGRVAVRSFVRVEAGRGRLPCATVAEPAGQHPAGQLRVELDGEVAPEHECLGRRLVARDLACVRRELPPVVVPLEPRSRGHQRVVVGLAPRPSRSRGCSRRSRRRRGWRPAAVRRSRCRGRARRPRRPGAAARSPGRTQLPMTSSYADHGAPIGTTASKRVKSGNSVVTRAQGTTPQGQPGASSGRSHARRSARRRGPAARRGRAGSPRSCMTDPSQVVAVLAELPVGHPVGEALELVAFVGDERARRTPGPAGRTGRCLPGGRRSPSAGPRAASRPWTVS